MSREMWDNICEIAVQRLRVQESLQSASIRTTDELTDLFLSNQWVQPTKRCQLHYQLYIYTQLFIMCALEHRGNCRPHFQFKTKTEMPYTQYCKFFKHLIDCMYSIRDVWIFPQSLWQTCRWAWKTWAGSPWSGRFHWCGTCQMEQESCRRLQQVQREGVISISGFWMCHK